MSNNVHRPESRRQVVVAPALQGAGPSPAQVIGVCVASAVLNALVILMFTLVAWLFSFNVGSASDTEVKVLPTAVEEPEKEQDLTITEVGQDASMPLNFDTNRIEEISVTGPADPTVAAGLHNAPDGPAQNIPPLPGLGGGTGLSMPDRDRPGTGGLFGTPGGDSGLYAPGGFGGRSGSTREKLVADFGGNALSEAAVARGLEWLALHQANDGHWSLHEFHTHAREQPLGKSDGKTISCNCGGASNRKNDIAATAFGVLPFLGAGITNKPPAGAAPQKDYTKTVNAALTYLMGKQGKNGYFGGDAYAHGLATIAMCEAYGLTSDPVLRTSAQRAVKYIVSAQNPGGGWRYSPKQAGDLSVTGWQLMALKSAQMSGLAVPDDAFTKCDQFLNSVESPTKKGRYSYLPDSNAPTTTMTSVGMLCRLYRGVNPRNPSLLEGIKVLMDNPPDKIKNQYYEYYATQVMHHVGGDSWQFWNLGPDGKGAGGIRDTLIRKQDKGADPKHSHQVGSFATEYLNEDTRSLTGGRIMATSLSLLDLEVYYRHLPLYGRGAVAAKEEGK
jgi:hypothetical protein